MQHQLVVAHVDEDLALVGAGPFVALGRDHDADARRLRLVHGEKQSPLPRVRGGIERREGERPLRNSERSVLTVAVAGTLARLGRRQHSLIPTFSPHAGRRSRERSPGKRPRSRSGPILLAQPFYRPLFWHPVRRCSIAVSASLSQRRQEYSQVDQNRF